MPRSAIADDVIAVSEGRKLPPHIPQSDDNKVSLVYRLFGEAKRAKVRASKNWGRNYKWYEGNQWPSDRPKWKASIVQNAIYSSVEMILAILTDRRPTVYALPREQQDAMRAEMSTRVLEYIWDLRAVDLVHVDVLKNALIFGTGFYKAFWDMEYGDLYSGGEIGVLARDPHNIFPDPNGTNEENCDYMLDVSVTSIRRLRLQYGNDKVDKVKPDEGLRVIDKRGASQAGDILEAEDFPTSEYNVPKTHAAIKEDYVGQYYTGTTDTIGTKREGGKEFYSEDAKVTVYEAFFNPCRDYPEGRILVTAGGVVLRDTPNPYKRIPLVRVPCHQLPNEFWGMSYVDPMIEPQRLLNWTISLEVDHANFSTHPRELIDSAAGIDVDAITGEPGEQIEYDSTMLNDPRGPIKYLQPPPLPQFVHELVQLSKDMLDATTGLYDVTQGRRPTGITAGVAITSLQEAAQTRIRLIERNTSRAMEKLGKLILSIASEYYKLDPNRMLRLVGADRQAEFVEIGQLVKEKPLDVDVKVVEGSARPVAREIEHQILTELLNNQHIDAEMFLESVDERVFPSKHQLLVKLRERMEQQMQMEQQLAEVQAALGSPAEVSETSPSASPSAPGP
jgi:hypothetical protein